MTLDFHGRDPEDCPGQGLLSVGLEFRLDLRTGDTLCCFGSCKAGSIAEGVPVTGIISCPSLLPDASKNSVDCGFRTARGNTEAEQRDGVEGVTLRKLKGNILVFGHPLNLPVGEETLAGKLHGPFVPQCFSNPAKRSGFLSILKISKNSCRRRFCR